MRTYKVKMPFEAGQVYGHLELVKCVVSGVGRKEQWICKCDCKRKERRIAEALRVSVQQGRVPKCDKCSLLRGSSTFNPTRNIARS